MSSSHSVADDMCQVSPSIYGTVSDSDLITLRPLALPKPLSSRLAYVGAIFPRPSSTILVLDNHQLPHSFVRFPSRVYPSFRGILPSPAPRLDRAISTFDISTTVNYLLWLIEAQQYVYGMV